MSFTAHQDVINYQKISKNIEDVWNSCFLHRGSDATTLSGYSYFNPKHNFLLYLGRRCSPKGGAPPFSPTYPPTYLLILICIPKVISKVSPKTKTTPVKHEQWSTVRHRRITNSDRYQTHQLITMHWFVYSFNLLKPISVKLTRWDIRGW